MAFTINKVDTNGYWKIGSTNIYIPSQPCKIEHSNVVGSSSGRDESGVMHIDWLRRDVRKVYLHYNYMTASELSTLFALTQGKEFTLTFRDQGSTKTLDGYVGETSYEFYTYDLEGVPIYKDVEIHVVEK